MARMPRVTYPGLPHHVIQRGNNRSAIFFDDGDYRTYLNWLAESMQRFGCSLHAYVLMTNHVHLLLTPKFDSSISRTLQSLGRRYVRYINGVYGRTCTLWEGRYKSSIVQSEQYLLACYRYIEPNPVKAGMVTHPGEYRWSSYAHNGLGKLEPLIEEHEEYLRLGTGRNERFEVYRGLFSGSMEDSQLSTIRESANRNQVLGNDRFKDEIECHLKRKVRLLNHGGDRRSPKFKKG